MIRRPPRSTRTDTLCPYTTLFRSIDGNDENLGFNEQTEQYENLFQSGVIDPTKVVRTALQDAASVAGLLIPTEAAVADLGDDSADPPVMANGMGGIGFRSEDRSVGKESDRPWRDRGSAYH